MDNFETFFKFWINKKVRKQLNVIDEISKETGIDAKNWFINDFLVRNINNHAGDEFLDVLLENFLLELSNKFEYLFKDYIEPERYNIYKEPIFDINISLDYDYKNNCIIIDEYTTDDDKEHIIKIIKSLTLEQKLELMNNKIFSYVINKTKLEVFSIKDIRALKLKSLNGL